MTVIEPGFTSGFDVGPARLEMGFRLALPLRRPQDISVEPLRSDFRLSVAVHRLLGGS